MLHASSPAHSSHHTASACRRCFALGLVCWVKEVLLATFSNSFTCSWPLSPPLSTNKRTTPSRSKAKTEIQYVSGGRRRKQKLKLSIRFKGDALRKRDGSRRGGDEDTRRFYINVKPKQTVEASRQLARLKQRECGINEATRERLATLSSSRRHHSVLPRYRDDRVTTWRLQHDSVLQLCWHSVLEVGV
jgi:hypothetical protein